MARRRLAVWPIMASVMERSGRAWNVRESSVLCGIAGGLAGIGTVYKIVRPAAGGLQAAAAAAGAAADLLHLPRRRHRRPDHSLFVDPRVRRGALRSCPRPAAHHSDALAARLICRPTSGAACGILYPVA